MDARAPEPTLDDLLRLVASMGCTQHLREGELELRCQRLEVTHLARGDRFAPRQLRAGVIAARGARLRVCGGGLLGEPRIIARARDSLQLGRARRAPAGNAQRSEEQVV